MNCEFLEGKAKVNVFVLDFHRSINKGPSSQVKILKMQLAN
jgi:hypothetical protein